MKRALIIISLIALNLSPYASSVSIAATSETLPIFEKDYQLSSSDFTCREKECLSEKITSENVFQNIAFEWQGDPSIHASLLEKGIWGNWYDVEGEKDAPDQELLPPNTQLLMVAAAQGFRIKTNNPAPEKMVVRIFNIAQAPTLHKNDVHISANEQPSSLSIIPRSEWLTGIELPWSDRSSAWPEEYDGVKKVIIHHTATNIGDLNGDGVIDTADYEQIARSIYNYHAKSRQWGDVGYNYLIDPAGNIWEGREGGDGVIAGHAFRDSSCKKFGAGNIGFNKGTIGIALIGNFAADTITPQARESLTSLIAKKGWEFSFDPAGSSFFNDQGYPNVIGHRDVDCTECPGNNVYNEFAGIIAEAKNKFDQLTIATPKTASAIVMDVSPREVDIKSGEQKTVTITAKNTGTTTWRNYGDNPVQIALADIKENLASIDTVAIAAEGKDTTTPVVSNSSLIGARLKDANVAPGQIGTFVVPIKDVPPELVSKKKFVITLGQQGWFPGSDVEVTVVNNGLPYAALLDTSSIPSSMLDETKTITNLQFENKGTEEWRRGDVKLKITDSGKNISSLKDASWKKQDGQFDFTEALVKPGETATFKVALYGKALGGKTQALALYKSKAKITGSDYSPLAITVNPGYAAEIISHSIPDAIQTGWQPSVTITVRNTGALPWNKATLLSYAKNGISTSPLRSSSWLSSTIVDRTGKVMPGEATIFLFKLKAPIKAGSYVQQFALKQGTRSMYLTAEDESLQKSLILTTRVDKPARVVKKK